MITRNIIEIPVYAGRPGMTRSAQVSEGIRKDFDNVYILRLLVKHYLNNVEDESLTTNDVYLRASNDVMVNPATGAVVEKDNEGNYPDGSVGEYDYLWNVVNVLKAKTTDQLEEIYINLRIHKINKQLYKLA